MKRTPLMELHYDKTACAIVDKARKRGEKFNSDDIRDLCLLVVDETRRAIAAEDEKPAPMWTTRQAYSIIVEYATDAAAAGALRFDGRHESTLNVLVSSVPTKERKLVAQEICDEFHNIIRKLEKKYK